MTGIIICFILILILELLTPFWWWVMVIPFLYCLAAARSGWKGFRVGMFSAGAVWLLAGLFFYLIGGKIIAARIAQIFYLGSSWLMIILTAVIAAVAAGVAGLAGFSLRALYRK